MKLLHVVADYGPGDLAFSEMVSALCSHLPDGWEIWPTTLHSFDTLGTGFCVGQLALQSELLRPKDMVVYANCAPRKDLSEARRNNQGEKLVYGELMNGVRVVVVNSGYSLSFIRDALSSLHVVEVSREGSQFRSRDIFPPIVGKVAHGVIDFLGKEIDPLEAIPDFPRGVVTYQDSFKNLKTSFRSGDEQFQGLVPGSQIDVTMNGITRPVTVSDGNFNVREGTMAFSPGSSGFERRFYEIFLRGGEAAAEFGFPRAGTEIKVRAPEKVSSL